MNFKDLKRRAKELSKATGESHCRCLEAIAKQYKFNTYAALHAHLLKHGRLNITHPAPRAGEPVPQVRTPRRAQGQPERPAPSVPLP